MLRTPPLLRGSRNVACRTAAPAHCFAVACTQPSLASVLTRAAKNGHAHVVRSVLAWPVDLTGDAGRDALRWAARAGHADVVQRVLAARLRGGHCPDPAGASLLRDALLCALAADQVAVVELLILRTPGVDPSWHSSYYEHALVWAARLGNVALLQYVMPRVDVRAHGTDALRAAVRANQMPALRLLLADGRVDPCTHYGSPLWHAATLGNADAVAALLARPRVDDVKDALASAAERGHAAVVALLLRGCRHPVANLDVALHYAARNGHVDVVALLVADPRADATALDAALRHALERHDAPMLEALLRSERVDPSDDDNAVLAWAAEHGHVRVVAASLAHPALRPSGSGDTYQLEYVHADVLPLLQRDHRVFHIKFCATP